MMFTCKQIAKKMADQKLKDMYPLKRWWMKLHIKMCVVCGEYQRDAERFQEAESCFADNETFDKKLDDESKNRLRQKMKECCNKDGK